MSTQQKTIVVLPQPHCVTADLPPLPSLNNSNVGSSTAVADLPNVASVGNMHMDSLADGFFDLHSYDGGDVGNDFLKEDGAPDINEASPLARRSLFGIDQLGVVQIAGGNKDKGATSRANFAYFPSKIPTLKNRFANQDAKLK